MGIYITQMHSINPHKWGFMGIYITEGPPINPSLDL